MEGMNQIRVLISAGVLVMSFAFLIWAAFEIRGYRRRTALGKLALIAHGKTHVMKVQKQRDLYFRRLFFRFSDLSVTIGQRINIFRKFVDAGRVSVRKAGLIDKNAVSYVIGAKLLAVPISPPIMYLVFQPYDFYQNNSGIVLLLSAVVGFFLPDLWLMNLRQKREKEITQNWADFLDVVLISVSSGQSIEAAMRKAVYEMATIAPELAKEFTITLAELSLLENRSLAYRRLADRLQFPFVKNFVFDIIQSETLGTPLGRALTQIAKENRQDKAQAVEKKAAALGPKLTIPMILFFFPILFVIIMAPAFL